MHDVSAVSTADRKRAMRQLHEIENSLSPIGFMEGIDAEVIAGNRALSEVMSDSKIAQDLRQFEHLEPYSAAVLSTEAVLFKGAQSPSGRRLLVGFTGRGHSLLLPTAGILQRFPANEWDLLLLRDTKLTHFREGCVGFGRSFPELAASVLEMGKSYTSIATLGVSMGGMAAIQLALIGENIRAVAVGPRRPSDVERLFDVSGAPAAYEAVCDCLPKQKRENLLFVYAADHQVDREEAELAAFLTGGVLVPVSRSGRHAILAELWLDGRLGSFMSVAFSSDALDKSALNTIVNPLLELDYKSRAARFLRKLKRKSKKMLTGISFRSVNHS